MEKTKSNQSAYAVKVQILPDGTKKRYRIRDRDKLPNKKEYQAGCEREPAG